MLFIDNTVDRRKHKRNIKKAIKKYADDKELYIIMNVFGKIKVLLFKGEQLEKGT